ncbi:Phosphate acyltransferase [Candidatus Bipolaricaulis anaerobius]|uniref:Phosphate acyltransferase n=1 Tax=Candidatus Bipolaricaulis anaerobius TaxID=2026885 RepID=A0A2X3K579_9BACT|nr:phosphate acyltransferase PlsX [Candidatus Bipolaricaulis anaerobius]SQD92427.1 Phosphate acyltransferase [Candidatus Bipolaricaulis anaerobius]
MEPRIVVDVMGADRPPAELAGGAIRAATALPIRLILVAHRPLLPPLPPGVEVLECPPAPEHEEGATRVARREDTSIARGLDALRRGEADAFLSPGSTGAVVSAAILRLGRLPGVVRPGLCASLPTLRGEVLLIDAGATADSKPAHLVQFADLGAAYAQAVLGIPSPTVGLLNIGTEHGKGDALTREAHPLLARTAGFVGNVEPHTILTERPVDVVVAGGFSGNLFLKAVEGGAEAVLTMVKGALRSSARARLGALLSRRALRAVAQSLRYEEHNAAPLLGVNGLVTVAHGRSDAAAIEGALRRTFQASRSQIVEVLRSRLSSPPAEPGLANPGDPRVPSATPTAAA